MAVSPSISGIMMSISTRSTAMPSGAAALASAASASWPLRANRSLAPLALKDAGQREDVAYVVLDDQDAACPRSTASRLRASRRMRCCSAGRSASTWCRNSVTSSSRRSGDLAPLMMIELA